MTQTARSIGANNLSGRLPVPATRDDVGRLSEAWNELLSRLEESFTRMQRFTEDAAHELRTPLAALRTTTDLPLRRERDPDEYRDALARVGVIAERMNELAEGLLSIARGEHAPAWQRRERVDFCSLVPGVTAETQPLFDDTDVRLDVTAPAKPIPLQAAADGLRRVLAILLDNALNYSNPGGKVKLVVDTGDDGPTLEVPDEGPGIPPESLARIFDRFYRVDFSRDRKTEGGTVSGLRSPSKLFGLIKEISLPKA